MSDDPLKRWRQLVRAQVRDHVRVQREPPPLTLWVSKGGNVRKCAAVRVGAASDSGDVAFRVREAIRDASAGFAALGRSLASVEPASAGPLFTTQFGLVIATPWNAEGWHAEIRAGEIAAWANSSTAELMEWGGAIVRLLQASLRDVEAVR